MERARHLRKRHGGAWRQAGMLAAAGLHALREHRQRLEQDHEVARELAAGLQELGFELVQEVETNMVWVDSTPVFGPMHGIAGATFSEVRERLRRDEGILVSGAFDERNPFGEQYGTLRFVTHMQTTQADVARLIAALHRMLPS